jgi:hypothetical protein
MNEPADAMIQAQKAMCAKYGSRFVPSQQHLKAGIALRTLSSTPITGVRAHVKGDTTGWYIWGGEYSAADDFYQPLCTSHLAEYCPEVLPYLGLAPGFSFIIDRNGYEDVWNDPERLERERTQDTSAQDTP